MDYIHSNGFAYTQEEVEQAAKKRNMSVQEYLDKTPELQPGKAQGSTEDPTMSQKSMGSQSDDGLSESVSWFDQTWFGRGVKAASTTGEATDLMSENFSNISKESIQEFIKAKEQESKSYVESERMKKFQKQYVKEGKTWSAFFRGVKDQPGLLPELFVQSLGTQVGTLIDSPGASLGAAATGAAGGAAVGAVPGAVAGFMGGLATSMEAALTFGELIETRLKEKNQDFTDDNIKALLESEGREIRNKALGRGLAIGAIEGFSGGLAGKAAVATKGAVQAARAGKVGKTGVLAAGASGVGVEAVGGATGEIAGRVVAGQEMDAAEIGFEAITGTVTAPVNVLAALKSAKQPTYRLNGEKVTYNQMKDFVDTADDMDVAKADIKMRDDYTGLGKKAKAKQEAAEKMIELSGDVATQQEVKKAKDLNKIAATIELAKQGKQISNVKDAFAVENNEEATKAYKELQDQYGKDVIKDQDVTDADGFFVPTPDGNVIIINKEVAAETGQINVGGHELLHGIVQEHYNSLTPEARAKFINDFKNTISKESLEYVQNIIDARNKDRVDEKTGKTIKGENIQADSDEYLTIYSDGIVKEQITYNEGVFTKFKNFLQDIFRKFGYNKEFGSGAATYNFMRDYNKNIMEFNKISERAKVVAGTKAVAGDASLSVSGFDQNEVAEDLGLKETTAGIVARNKEIENTILEEGIKDEEGNIKASPVQQRKLAENNLPRAFALAKQAAGKAKDLTLDDALKIDDVMEFYSEYSLKLTELARTYKAQMPDGTKVPFGAYMNSLLPLKYSGILEKLKSKIQTTSMSDETVGKKVRSIEDTTDETAKTKGTKTRLKQRASRKLTSLADLDIESSPLIKEVTKIKLKKLIESNPKNLVEQIQEILISDLVEIIRQEMGVIGQKDGKLNIPDDYNAYLSDTYQLTISSMEISKIRANYKNLFRKEKMGFADYKTKKSDKPSLKKDSNYVKDINRNVTTKAEFIKYHTEGKKNKLIANQKNLAIMRAEAEVVRAADNYIIDNSQNLNEVFAAELRKYIDSKTIEKQKLEDKSFDSVKFSKTIANPVNVKHFNELINEGINGEIGSDIWISLTKIANPVIVEEVIKIIDLHNADYVKETSGFKDRVRNLIFPKKIKEKYFARPTNKNHTDSIAELLDFTESLAEVMDPALVSTGLFEDMFGFTYRYGDKNRIGKDTYGKVMDSASKRKSDKNFEDKYGFDPEAVKKYMYNSTFGIMNRINTIANKSFNTAKEKLQAMLDKEGANIEQANKQNYKVLEYIITKAIQVVNKNPDKLVGALRWLESATSTIKGLRGLTRLTHLDVMAESQAPSTKHPDYEATYKVALESVRKKNKAKKLDLSKSQIEETAKESALAQLKPKGEHLKPSANLMASFAELIIKYSKLDMGNPKTLTEFKKDFNKLIDGYDQALGNKSTYAIVDKTMGSQAEGDVRLLTGLPKNRAKRFYHVSGNQSVGYISRTITQSKEFAKLSNKADKAAKLNNAVKRSRSVNKESKGITVLDFDDTLATTKSLVKYTRPDGTTGTLNAEQYASTYEDLLDQGFTFDFSDFNKVVKGKVAPLFQKALKLQGKFGPENMFVLTARPPQAAKAIFDFLKANGLNIPMKNITGLANSTAEAKALWIADKVGEGYNDFYFADDALQNVQAVKNMLEQFDVKSKVQQAKVKFSKSMNDDFNNILEEVTGIETKKRFSDIKARKRGKSKGKFRLFIPPSHEDFVGLLYNFMGKGRKGDQHRDFFEQALVRPLNRAYREIDTAKQAIANDYKQLNKQFEDVKKKLRKKTPDGDFTFEDATRVYLWNKHGYDIPGLSPTDQANLVELVMADQELRQYAETLNVISKQEKYVDPGNGWEAGNIKTDLMDATGRVGRAEFFAEFNENADILFSPENLNKIEAAYGKDFRSALEDILHRIKTGVNRPKGQSGTINSLMNYLNGSVGTVMFFNVRSAILQQMSIVNYINFADNNLFAAAKAFANQKQYWKDFAFIFNSDMLKQRRGGIGTDINGADLAQAVEGSKQPTKIVISKLLKLGFLPTQIGDNIAIATGGATFYRNRINKYIKDGLSQKEAETKAFTDFQDLTQSTQQSSRPDMTSKQQASWIGKLVLNFQNITSQYNRIIKKAALDIGKGRISPPYTTKAQSNLGNLSKILYYGGIQNVIFYSLQTALFAVMFDDDDDEDQILKKKERVIQGSIDSILRGAGIYGAVASTLKNMIIKFKEQREKGYNKDESAVPMELLNFSPVVGIKIRQLVNAEKTLNYNENVISEMETFDADNPQWSAVTNYTQALTNFPANRLYQKSINVRNALDKDYTNFQRVLFFSGYTTWSLGLGDNEKIIEAKEKAKINKKNKKKSKNKTKTTSAQDRLKAIRAKK